MKSVHLPWFPGLSALVLAVIVAPQAAMATVPTNPRTLVVSGQPAPTDSAAAPAGSDPQPAEPPPAGPTPDGSPPSVEAAGNEASAPSGEEPPGEEPPDVPEEAPAAGTGSGEASIAGAAGTVDPAAPATGQEGSESAPPEAATVTADAEPAEPAWHDDLSFGAFVDAYFGLNTNFPRPQGGNNALRAFDGANGFSLAWAGVNAAYAGERAGATIDLRFGTGPNAGWADDAIPGIQIVKQAYATWNALPDDKLSFDFGRFDTIYGAEVSESWMNHTYTRGALYNLAQPFWHTGLRVGSQINDTLSVKGLLVNGWGHIVDNNLGKSVGLQFGITPGDVVGLYVGYLGGPESDDVDENGVKIDDANRAFRHLADVVLTVDVKRLSLAFNADYVYDDTPVGFQQWYGGMLSAHFQALPKLGFAARGEYLGDPNGFMSGIARNQLATGTISIDVTPAKMLSLRLDARGDASWEPLFTTGTAEPTDDPMMPTPPELRQYQFTVTLGAVVHSF